MFFTIRVHRVLSGETRPVSPRLRLEKERFYQSVCLRRGRRDVYTVFLRYKMRGFFLRFNKGVGGDQRILHEVDEGPKKMMDEVPQDGGLLSGDECMEDVMEQYQPQLLRYAARVLNNAEAAQDAVQDAFVRLHRNWQKVVERRIPVRGWLYRTTHNAAVDYIRKETRLRALHERQFEFSETIGEGADCQLETLEERHALVLQNLNALNPKEREVLVLRLQEGMSYREIAEIIHKSEGYVGTLIFNATHKLGQRLRKAGVVS